MSKLKLTTLANIDDSKSVPVDTVVNGSAKAWVNFTGTGTVAINAAFNVTSITDNGTGNYTINFTNAMPDANYSIGGFAQVGSNSTVNKGIAAAENDLMTVSAVQVRTTSGTASFSDATKACIQIFR